MRERRSEADLAAEALGAECGGEIGVKHLERDLAAVLPVGGEVNRRHPAATELALERVLGAKRRLHLVEKLCRHPGVPPKQCQRTIYSVVD